MKVQFIGALRFVSNNMGKNRLLQQRIDTLILDDAYSTIGSSPKVEQGEWSYPVMYCEQDIEDATS